MIEPTQNYGGEMVQIPPVRSRIAANSIPVSLVGAGVYSFVSNM